VSREQEYINVSDARLNVRAFVRGIQRIRGPGGAFTGQVKHMYSTRTTDVYAILYTVNKKRYADIFVVLTAGKKYYTAVKQFKKYVESAMKRAAHVARKLRRLGYSVNSSQIVCAGNFTRECITVARGYRKIEEAKITTSVRVVPVKPVRKHRIGRFVIRNFIDVAPVVLFWLGTWIHNRSVKLTMKIVARKQKPGDDPLWNVLSGIGEKILTLLEKVFGKDVLNSLWEGVKSDAGPAGC